MNAITANEKRTIVPGKIIGSVVVIFSEVMLFAGFISSFLISRANQSEWPPVGQERMPLEFTIINTLILLIGGIALYVGRTKKNAKPYIITALVTGILFFLLQGQEWSRLISYGMTVKENMYASFFYLIIGAHAIHVLMGILALTYLLLNERYKDDETSLAISMFWHFVVWLWPVLYYLIYIL